MTARDPSRRTLALRGAGALAVLALVVGLLAQLGRGSFTEHVDVLVQVDDGGGSLVPGADVKLRGVVVGEVTAIRGATTLTADPDIVEIAVRLDPALADDVPADVRARVLPATVFGTSFVELVARGRDGDRFAHIRAGQVVRQDRSRATLEVQHVLDGLDRVVAALGPAELATTLDSLATTLDGNGEKLGRTVVTLERYLSRLNPRMPLVRRNLSLLATNLDAFSRYAPDLLDATDDALVAARTVTARQDDFSALVRSGARTFGDTEQLLRRNERALVDSLVRTAVLVDVLYDGRAALVDGVLSVLGLAEEFGEALSHGRFLRIDGKVQLREEAAYGRAGCPRFGDQVGRGC